MALGILVATNLAGNAIASDLYFEDGSGTDINSTIIEGDACLGCHVNFLATPQSTTCDGPDAPGDPYDGLDTPWIGGLNGSATTNQRYLGTGNCAGNILLKIQGVPTNYGNRMPDGCVTTPVNTCVAGAHITDFTNWIANGRPLSAPTVNVDSVNSSQKTTAVITFDVDTNTAFSQGSYSVVYGLTTGYGTNAITPVTRNLITQLSNTSVTLGNGSPGSDTPLSCGTQYFYRVRSSNGAADADATGSFTTASCTVPVISGGGVTINMSEDSTPDDFLPPNLSVTDDDPGTLTWTIEPGDGAGFGTATASGNGNSEVIDYTPNLNYTGPDSFTVTVTNGLTGLSATHTINVLVNAVDDPPEITEGAGPIAQTIDEDGNPTAFSLTLNATDTDTAGSGLTWSIDPLDPADFGTASASGSGFSKAIGYTPNPDYEGPDSFTVRVSDGGSTDTIRIDVTVSPRNDSPVIPAIGPQAGIEGSLVTITPGDPDIDDANDGSGALTWSFVSGQQPGMSISNQGVITWTPPLGPPAVFGQTYPITIRVADGGEHGAVPDDESFVLTIDPPDREIPVGDGVADYDDFCPDTFDPTNANSDPDGTAGFDADPNDTIGGDACDTDDDNDGMPDIFETNNSLDPFDAADALIDSDGDGISNLDEFLAGTNPNSPNLAIDATGYYTPFELPIPDPKDYHPDATALTPTMMNPGKFGPYGPYRPGDNTITWIPSNATVGDLSQPPHDALLVSNPPEQVFLVRPLLNFAADQIAEEGATVNVTLSLNGYAPAYPVTVNYSVSGTATAGVDYTAPAPASGSVTFTMPTPPNLPAPQTISFTLAAADGVDPNETIVFAVDSATNAAIGSMRTHTVTIIEDNVAPQASLRFSQGGSDYGSVITGTVDINVDVTDINVGQTHSYDWSGTDNALVAPAGAVPPWTTPALAPGNYRVEVVVTDSGAPARSVSVSRILNVVPPLVPPLSDANNSDQEGAGDMTEGFDDSDGDGIPDYLDALDATAANLLADQTADVDDTLLLETETGLRLAIGDTSQASGSYGASITDSEIANFGNRNGGASLYPGDDFSHFGGVYDFRVIGMVPGSSARIVIPLQTSIPRGAEFRKFDPDSGWGPFIENNNNALYSAQGDLGACPEPGSDLYLPGLNYLANCLQLLVEDGGPNDSDKLVNGEFADPGTLGARLTEPVLFEEVEDGGGQMSVMLMTLLALLGLVPGLRRWLVARG